MFATFSEIASEKIIYSSRRGGGGQSERRNRHLAALAKRMLRKSGIRPAKSLVAARIAASDKIVEALATAKGRCTSRTVSAGEILKAVVAAARAGKSAYIAGSGVSGSYGYSYTTTRVHVRPKSDGIHVEINRSRDAGTVVPWDVAAATTTNAKIIGGAKVGIRDGDAWKCYAADGSLAHRAYRVTDSAVAARFGNWEHAGNRRQADAETARKRAIIDAETKEKADTASRAKRLERAAKLLAAIGHRTTVTRDMVKSVGACASGIDAWCAGQGISADATMALADIARRDETGASWALKVARKLVSTRI